MDFSPDGSNSPKNYTGIGVVVLLHVALIYALATGLAHKVVEVIQEPVETMIINEAELPPPPPPPPPQPKQIVKPTKATPTFVPPPEVVVEPEPVEEVIKAVSNIESEVDLPVEQTVVSEESPAPSAPPAPPAPPVRSNATVAGNCEPPEYPRSSLLNEEEGDVTIEMKIDVNGKVVDSTIIKSSGFRKLDRATLNAWSLCHFIPATVNGKPVESEKKLKYQWKIN